MTKTTETQMTATNTAIRNVIDAISRDSRISDDPAVVAGSLRRMYASHLSDLRAAIADLLADEAWSSDAAPYNWLREVSAAL
jgi:hypothetical protein